METSTPPPKKGLGVLAWLGIGCGGIVVLLVILAVVAGIWLKPMITKFAAEAQTNPTRAAAGMMVSVSAGQLEMVAEDDVNKRYTLRQKKNGDLITMYWDARQKKPITIKGDFSAIPADAPPPPSSEPAPR
jgi:hypothetical protein